MKSRNLTVAIIGRQNVGKSTLFNRLIGESKALVSPTPGTTRDRNYGTSEWRGIQYTVVDTGGLDVLRKDEIERAIVRQAELAMKEAHLILFVVDLRLGIRPEDRELARALRAKKKVIIVVGNKAERAEVRREAENPAWAAFGFGPPIPVSAATGIGTGDLLDLVVARAEEALRTPALADLPTTSIAVVGRPNVGKSSFVNALLGEERVIVSDIPHTTREPQDTLFLWNPIPSPREPDRDSAGKSRSEPRDGAGDEPIVIIDTAGIRKRAKRTPGIEEAGVMRSLRAAERADVVLFFLEAGVPIASQERRIGKILAEAERPVILVINKWDLVRGKTSTSTTAASKKIYAELPGMDWAPIIFISAKNRERIARVVAAALDAKKQYERRIDDRVLEEFIQNVRREARSGIRHPKVLSFKQTGVRPPRFYLAVREKEPLNPAYLGFLERRLRERFGFAGAPIRVFSKGIRLRV